ncbi:MAG: hypothetical protein CL946_01130 [Ectothiorhodospiraceae bacterium]|nr:hypothetical protein [Ectothiorhodospiraceae bacterium]
MIHLLEPYLGDTVLAVLLAAVLILAGTFLLAWLARLVIRFIEKRIAEHTRTRLDNIFLETLGKYVVSLAMIVGGYFLFQELALELREVPEFVIRVLEGVSSVLFVILVVYAGYVLIDYIRAIVEWYLDDVAVKTESRLDTELAPLIRRMLNMVIFLLVIIVVLEHFDQDISTIVVSLGVGSLAVALAAQDTLSNTIAGFVLLIDRPFRIGDRVELVDGTVGNIEGIGIRTTKLIDDYQVMIIIPNAEIVKDQIHNMSYPNDIVRFIVEFGVAYGTDLSYMRKSVLDKINAEPDIVEPDTSEVRIMELGNSSVNAHLLCKIQNPNNIPRRKAELLQLVYEALYESDIEIPFPQRVLHLGKSAQDAFGKNTSDS